MSKTTEIQIEKGGVREIDNLVEGTVATSLRGYVDT